MTEDMLLRDVTRVGRRRTAHRTTVKNLGWSIFVLAIRDFQRGKAELHADAKRFLYPRTRARREHFEWAASVAAGLDSAWFREVLDRWRSRWVRERKERSKRQGNRGLRTH